MKMKNKIKGMTFILSMALASVSLAENSASEGSTYVGLGYHMGTYDKDVNNVEADLTAFKLEFGKYFSQHTAIQASFLIPHHDTSMNNFAYATIKEFPTLKTCCFHIDIEMKSLYSVMVKRDLHINSKVQVYGLLGVSQGRFEGKIPVLNKTLARSTISHSYGLGIEGELSNSVSLNAEYVNYMANSAYEYTALNVGLIKKF